MKILSVLLVALSGLFAGSLAAEEYRIGELCEQASREVNTYVTMTCRKVGNRAQDNCIAFSLLNYGWANRTCLDLSEGDQCAITSLKEKGYIALACPKIVAEKQDLCASNSISEKGFVEPSCLAD